MSTSPEVMKWFTRARRFPQLIGRTPDGARIPGGPYTVTQVVGAGAVLFLGTQTMGLWAHYGLLSNAFILATVTFAVVFGLGKIPVGSRNPLSVFSGALRALSAPPTGRLAGRPVRLRRPHQVRHQLVTLLPTPASPSATPPTSDLPSTASPAATPAHTQQSDLDAAPRTSVATALRRWLSPTNPTPSATGRAPRTRSGRAKPRQAAPQAALSAPPPTPTPTAPPPPVPTQRVTPALTGVQALLARSGTDMSSPAPQAPPRPATSRRKDH